MVKSLYTRKMNTELSDFNFSIIQSLRPIHHAAFTASRSGVQVMVTLIMIITAVMLTDPAIC